MCTYPKINIFVSVYIPYIYMHTHTHTQNMCARMVIKALFIVAEKQNLGYNGIYSNSKALALHTAVILNGQDLLVIIKLNLTSMSKKNASNTT